MIDPQPDTNIRLDFSREPRPGIDPGGTFSLPMENVKGWFVYDNGTVTMRDVGFQFFGAPVQFESGMVRVEDSGRFRLGVTGVGPATSGSTPACARSCRRSWRSSPSGSTRASP